MSLASRDALHQTLHRFAASVPRRRVRWYEVLGLTLLFFFAIVLAAVLHLNLAVTRRLLNRALTDYLNQELVGSFDLGRIERLDASTVWVTGLAAYDDQHRRVITIGRLRAKTRTFQALYDWLVSNEKLTVVVESIWAEGVTVRLLPTPNSTAPSLAKTFELDPALPKSQASSAERPYRIALQDIVLNETQIENQLSSIPVRSGRFKTLSGLVLITKEGVAVSLKRFGMQIDAGSNLELRGTGTADFRSPDRIWGELNATLGNLPLNGRFDYRNEQLDAALEFPRLTPELTKVILPDWPLRTTASVSLSTNGPLKALATRLQATVANSRLDIVGTTALSSSITGIYGISGTDIDLGSFFGASIQSQLSLHARAEVRFDGSSPEAKFDGLIDSGTLLQKPTPPLDFEGKLDGTGLLLSLRSRDTKWPIRAGMWVHEGRVDLDAQTQNIPLSNALASFGIPGGSGMASVRAKGRIISDQLSVEAHATLKDAKLGNFTAKAATVEAHFEGPLTEPQRWDGILQVNTDGFRAPFVSYPLVQATLRGTPLNSNLSLVAEDGPNTHLTVETEIDVKNGILVRHSKIGLKRNAQTLTLGVKRARISEKTVDVEGLNLEGSAGTLAGDLAWYEGGGLTAKLSSDELELTTLNDLLNLPPTTLSGTAVLRIDLDTRNVVPRGRTYVAVSNANLGPLFHVTGNWEQSLTEKNLHGVVTFSSNLVERVQGNYDLALNGPLTSLSTFSQSIGNVNWDLEGLHLERLKPLLPMLPNTLNVGGKVFARFQASRTTNRQLPDLVLSVTTDGLSVDWTQTNGQSIRLNRSELLGSATYEGFNGTLNSDWVLSKQQQPLAHFGLKSQVDLLGFLTDPLLARARLYELPFDAWFAVPRRPLSDVEAIVGVTLGTGTVQSRIWLKGPLTDPHVVVEFQGERLQLAALENPIPVDLQGVVEFAHKNGETRMTCGIGHGQTVWARLNAIGNVFANPNTGRLPNAWPYDWAGKVEVGFTEFPIEAITGLYQSQVKGQMRGGVTLSRQNGRTKLNALLPISNLYIQSRPVGQSLISVNSSDRELVTTLKLIDGGAQVDVEAVIPVDDTQPLPVLREDAKLMLSAQATGYDAGILAPFLDPYLGQIQGELNGNFEATYHVAPASSTEEDSGKLALGGHIKLRNGRGRLRALGVNLTDISLDAQASSTGSRTLIHVPMAQCAIGATTPNLEATVVVELEKLALKRLGATITRAHAVPLILDGVTQATMTGTATLELVPVPAGSSKPTESNGYRLDASLGEFVLTLPRQMARKVVALSENKDIQVLQPLGSAAFKKTQPTSLVPYRIVLDLGKKARVTRNDFTIPVSGKPTLQLKDKLYTSGNIKLEPGGRLELAGKTFIIERGLVTLNPEEANNPRFDVEAHWRGPSHTVIATVTGTRKEAELHLTSDPPLANESQVFALLLSGSNTDVDSKSAGIGVGATIFNEFMSETPLAAVELRTSQDEQHANYTAAVPLKENLWFEGTYQNATNSGLRPNSSTSREGFSGTVDWRFRRNWSLRTEVGTLGAGADILWQYRY